MSCVCIRVGTIGPSDRVHWYTYVYRCFRDDMKTAWNLDNLN